MLGSNGSLAERKALIGSPCKCFSIQGPFIIFKYNFFFLKLCHVIRLDESIMPLCHYAWMSCALMRNTLMLVLHHRLILLVTGLTNFIRVIIFYVV